MTRLTKSEEYARDTLADQLYEKDVAILETNMSYPDIGVGTYQSIRASAVKEATKRVLAKRKVK